MGIDRTHERMVAVFLLGIALLLPPLLLLFNRPMRVLGLPVLYLYVFATWALLIALAALIASRISPDMTSDRTAGEASKSEGA